MIKKLSPQQKRILRFVNQDEKYLICDGAVRTGKTVFMTMAFVIWAMENFDGCNFAICAKTVTNAERNIIMPLLNSGELPYALNYRRKEALLNVSLGNKTNSFYLFGGKDESSYTLIQGITLAGVLLDEVALMPRSFVEQAFSRTITFDKAKILCNCNPEGQLHWFNQEWIIPADEGKKEGVIHLHFRLSDNPILSAAAIKATENMYSGIFYRRYILGEWCMSEGLIYDMFNPDIHTGSAETEGDYYVSCDFGIQNATVFLLWQKEKAVKDKPFKDRWVCLDEWYYSGRTEHVQKTCGQLVDGLKQMTGDRRIKQVIVDPSAAALITELRKAGFHTRAADNDVKDGISDVATMLHNERLLFSPKCRNTLHEFGVYCWDAKAAQHGEDKPVKENDHAMDAVRYFVKTMYLVKRGK